MDEERALELLAGERDRIERAIATNDAAGRQDASEQEEPGRPDIDQTSCEAAPDSAAIAPSGPALPTAAGGETLRAR